MSKNGHVPSLELLRSVYGKRVSASRLRPCRLRSRRIGAPLRLQQTPSHTVSSCLSRRTCSKWRGRAQPAEEPRARTMPWMRSRRPRRRARDAGSRWPKTVPAPWKPYGCCERPERRRSSAAGRPCRPVRPPRSMSETLERPTGPSGRKTTARSRPPALPRETTATPMQV